MQFDTHPRHNFSEEEQIKLINAEVKRVLGSKNAKLIQTDVIHGYQQTYKRTEFLSFASEMIKTKTKTVAAKRIQRLWRGFIVRWKLWLKKGSKNATVIQSLWRGYALRISIWRMVDDEEGEYDEMS